MRRITDGPKPPEVFAADFRDRVVHHLLVSQLEKLYEPRFIHDSYACRRGKGTLAASDRLMAFLRRATANGRGPAWAPKLDVASFFPSERRSRPTPLKVAGMTEAGPRRCAPPACFMLFWDAQLSRI